MNEKVQQFLGKKREEERIKYEKKKQKVLDELGLYEKVYSNSNLYSEEFPYVDDNGRFYRKDVVGVSDEEYEEIKKYYDKINEEYYEENNRISIALTAVGYIIFIVGAVAGIFIGIEAESFVVTLIYWFATLISGMLFLGIAEIVKLLDAIRNEE